MSDYEPPGLSGPDAARLAGISYRQLDYWARTGVVSSSLGRASGSGTRRLYSLADVTELRMVKRLLDLGPSLDDIRWVLVGTREVAGSLSACTIVERAASPQKIDIVAPDGNVCGSFIEMSRT